MRPAKLIWRLTTLSVATIACLLLALLAPALFHQRASDEPFSGASVMASPRDVHAVTDRIRLSSAPDLVLARGVLYADGNAALGTPISRFVLDGPVFLLNAFSSASSGADALVPAASATPPGIADVAPLVEQLAAMGFDALTIRRGTLQIALGDGASETIGEIEAEVSGRRKGQVTARGSFSYRGQRLKFEAALPQPADKKPWPLKASLKSAYVDATFEGSMDVSRDLQLTGIADVTLPSLRRVARWFSIAVPNAEGLNETRLKGQFTWTRRSLAFEQARITIDKNEGSGTLSLILGGERPLVDGTLAFSAIDLLPYYEGLRPQTFGFERTPTSWATLDLTFPLVRYVDTDLRISTPKVTFKGFDLGRTAATLTVRSGKLLADVAEIELGAGSASLQLTADTNELVPRYALKGKFDNIESGQLAAAFLASAPWTGKASMHLDLAGVGQAPIEVLRSLSGKASLQLAPGARVPVDLKGLRALAKGGAQTGWVGIAKGQTQFEQLDVRATLSNGVAVMETHQGRAGAHAFALSGQMLLPDTELDLRLAVRAVSAAERATPTPPRASDFLGADVVRLRGPMRAPSLMAEDLGLERGVLSAPVELNALPQ